MQYKYGRKKELQVGEFLGRRGFEWDRSPASRGAADIIAKKSKKIFLIQVKATRKDETSYFKKLSIDEEKNLIKQAKKFKVFPILALVSRNYVWFLSVPSGRILLKGELRPFKYDHRDEI